MPGETMQIRLFSSLFTYWQSMSPAPGPGPCEPYEEAPAGPHLPQLLLSERGPS